MIGKRNCLCNDKITHSKIADTTFEQDKVDLT